MPKTLMQYRVFIGSPGGLEEERRCFRHRLERYTAVHSELHGLCRWIESVRKLLQALLEFVCFPADDEGTSKNEATENHSPRRHEATKTVSMASWLGGFVPSR